MNNLTNKTFVAKLGSWKRSAKSLRDNLQDFILFGLSHLSETGDSHYLTKVVAACNEVKTVSARKVQRYIEANGNHRWTTLKDGTEGFKKSVKHEADPVITAPVQSWYEFEKADSVPVPFDADRALTQVISTITAKLGDKETTYAKGGKAHARKVLKVVTEAKQQLAA